MTIQNLSEIIESGDQARIREKALSLLKLMGDGTGQTTIYCAQACLVELQRLGIERKSNSPQSAWRS